MTQKISLDPDIINYKILRNSLKEVDKNLKNLIEIKKMDEPVIFLNNNIKEKIIENICELKNFFNEKITLNSEYRKLSNNTNKVEIFVNEIFNSPEIICKINKQELKKLEFKKFIKKLYSNFGPYFLDYIVVNSKINSGFIEIDKSLSDYLEKKKKIKRELILKKDIKNFNEFREKILDTMGINNFEEDQKIYLVNPGVLNKIEKNDKNYKDLITTIKSICFYFYKKINDFKFRPKILVITDNANFGSNNNNFRNREAFLRKKFLNSFQDIENYISLDFLIIDRWKKKSQPEQRFIFSSNEFGYSLNIEIDFLSMGKWGTKIDEFKTLEDNFLQLKVAKDGIFKEVIKPIYRSFIIENIIKKAENNLSGMKNPAFHEIFQKIKIS